MEIEAVVSALVQAGGYAVLCALLIRQGAATQEAHRAEVHELSDALRENTSAVSALAGNVAGLLAGVRCPES